MSRSDIWLHRRAPWKYGERRGVNVDGVKYIRADLFERLWTERANLVRKWKRERDKRRALEQKLRPTRLGGSHAP